MHAASLRVCDGGAAGDVRTRRFGIISAAFLFFNSEMQLGNALNEGSARAGAKVVAIEGV